MGNHNISVTVMTALKNGLQTHDSFLQNYMLLSQKIKKEIKSQFCTYPSSQDVIMSSLDQECRN